MTIRCSEICLVRHSIPIDPPRILPIRKRSQVDDSHRRFCGLLLDDLQGQDHLPGHLFGTLHWESCDLGRRIAGNQQASVLQSNTLLRDVLLVL